MSGREANWTPEARAAQAERVRAWLHGRPVVDATREKIATPQRGSNGHNWQGDGVGYMGAHKRHRATLPKVCAICGKDEGRLDVALRKDAPLENLLGCVKRKRLYSARSDDYLRLCRSCHLSYDRT